MRKEVKFQTEEFAPDWVSDYSEKKFTVFSTCFLSTKKNSHELDISEEVLRKDAQSILGNFLVAKLQYGDATTHLSDEIIYGYFPREQEIVFEEVEENNEKIVKAKAFCVISKMYGQEFNDIFSYNNLRNTSVEMAVETEEDDENKVLGFDIYGLTCLGMTTKGSCPDANMKMVRFSEDEADKFFAKVHKNSLTALEQFAESRKKLMAETKSYKIDKSKETMSTADWSNVDKTALRNKIIEAKNASTLVKSVYLKVDADWSEAPSERLHYPVMQFDGDTLVYNRNALSNALARAVQNDETAVVNKIKKIYKNLGLDQDGKEADTKMAEIAFAAVDIGDMWGKMWNALHAKYPDGDWGSVYRIDGIYEEDNKKFAIIHHKDDDAKYRLDFSLTEEGLTLSDEIVKVELEIVETDEVKKFAEPENADKYKKFEDCGCDDGEGDENKKTEMSADEMKAEMARLQSEVENRDNIIMEKDAKMGEMEAELSELREYKAACEKKELATSVESLMSEVKECMAEDDYKRFRDEGLTCKMSELDAWSNKVKAFCFENGKVSKGTKKDDGILRYSVPVETTVKKNSLWD